MRGPLKQFILGTVLAWLVTCHVSHAAAGPLAYIVARDALVTTTPQPDLFGQVDLTTGAFKVIGELSTPGFTISGLGYGPDGKLYGVALTFANFAGPGEFFRIDPTLGAATDLGALTYNPLGGSSNSSGTLYALDSGSPASLFAILPPSNSSNLIGPTTFSSDGLVALDSKGNLFAAGNGDGSFFRVSTNDATSTLIGNTGLGNTLYTGTFVGNTLYGFSVTFTTNTIVTIDTSNASVTMGAEVSLPTNYQVYAAISAVPEPSSVVLGLIGGTGVLACVLLRRSKTQRLDHSVPRNRIA
jgi:PEP-CTERM motif